MNRIFLFMVFFLPVMALCHAQEFILKPVMELKLADKIGQLRAVTVTIGKQ